MYRAFALLIGVMQGSFQKVSQISKLNCVFFLWKDRQAIPGNDTKFNSR